MKKIIGVVTALSIAFASSAFAVEFKVIGDAKGQLDFGVTDYNDSTNKLVVSGNTVTDTKTTNWNDPNVTSDAEVDMSFEVTSDDESSGAHVDINFVSDDTTVPAIGDEAKVWTTLFDMLKLEFGKVKVDDLRGSIGDYDYEDVTLWQGKDAVFKRFSTELGMTAELRPVEGLFIGASLDPEGSLSRDETFRGIQFGVGYEVPDLIQVKGQWIGKTSGKYGDIQLGADLLMLGDNLIEIGVTIPIEEDSSNTDLLYAIVALKGGSEDGLSYKGELYCDLNKKGYEVYNNSYSATDTVPTIGINAGLKYNMGDFGIAATAGYAITTAKADYNGLNVSGNITEHALQAGLFLEKNVEPGVFFIGLKDAFNFATASWSEDNYSLDKSYSSNTFSIPVGVMLSF